MTRCSDFAVDLRAVSGDKHKNIKLYAGRRSYRVIGRSGSTGERRTVWPEEVTTGVRAISSLPEHPEQPQKTDPLQNVIVGCKVVKSRLFTNLDTLLADLTRFSKIPHAHDRLERDGWIETASAAVEKMHGDEGPDVEILQLVKSRRALDEYFSTSFVLQQYLFDFFLSYQAALIEGVRTFLDMDSERDGNVVSLSFYDPRMDWLGSGIGESLSTSSSPGFLLAQHRIAVARDELQSAYFSVVEPFWELVAEHSKLMKDIFQRDARAEAILNRWDHTFMEAEDCLRDADNLFASIDAALHELGSTQDRFELKHALDALSGCNLTHVDGILKLAMNVHMAMAKAQGVTIRFGEFPNIEVPVHLRRDLFRSVSELVLNAIENADKKKNHPFISVQANREESMLNVSVEDNGMSFVDPAGKTMPKSKGGLARLQHTIGRRRWSLYQSLEPKKGTQSRLFIDLSEWEKVADAAQKTTQRDGDMLAVGASAVARERHEPSAAAQSVAYAARASAGCALLSAPQLYVRPML